MVTLNTGMLIPSIGFGTYKINGSEGIATIKAAIDIGYRLFDTAFVYGNEQVLGQAFREQISECKVKREDLFVVSKLGSAYHRPERVKQGCLLSLERLGLDYIDMYLMHTPVAMKGLCDINDRSGIDDEVTPAETWKALEECQRLGLVRSIGVSNFNEKQLKILIEVGTITPVVNQVECSVGFHQADMRKFCEREGILVMAYSPLGKPKPGKEHPFLDSTGLNEMAETYKKSVAQISLRYLIDRGVIPIPKSTNTARMRENLDVLNFKLETFHVTALDSLVEQKRSMHLDWLKTSKYYPF